MVGCSLQRGLPKMLLLLSSLRTNRNGLHKLPRLLIVNWDVDGETRILCITAAVFLR